MCSLNARTLKITKATLVILTENAKSDLFDGFYIHPSRVHQNLAGSYFIPLTRFKAIYAKQKNSIGSQHFWLQVDFFLIFFLSIVPPVLQTRRGISTPKQFGVCQTRVSMRALDWQAVSTDGPQGKHKEGRIWTGLGGGGRISP